MKESIKAGQLCSVAFVDMRMPPGWDGVETITHFWGWGRSIQIVICTAYSDYSGKDIQTQLGGSGCLLIFKKSFDMVEVL